MIISLFRYLFIIHVLWDNMHAFMALFFYELVRDQIVFIWHAWAMVVGPQMIIVPVCRTMPSVLLWWRRQKKKRERTKRRRRKEKKALPMTKRCQRREFLIICVLHIYLFNNLLTSPETRAPLPTQIFAASAASVSPHRQKKLQTWARRQRLTPLCCLFFCSCPWF